MWEIVDILTDREAIQHTHHPFGPDDALVEDTYYIDTQDPDNIGWAIRSRYVESDEEFASGEQEDRWWTLFSDIPTHVQLHACLMQERFEMFVKREA